jgi:hypothetical protein
VPMSQRGSALLKFARYALRGHRKGGGSATTSEGQRAEGRGQRIAWSLVEAHRSRSRTEDSQPAATAGRQPGGSRQGRGGGPPRMRAIYKTQQQRARTQQRPNRTALATPAGK